MQSHQIDNFLKRRAVILSSRAEDAVKSIIKIKIKLNFRNQIKMCDRGKGRRANIKRVSCAIRSFNNFRFFSLSLRQNISQFEQRTFPSDSRKVSRNLKQAVLSTQDFKRTRLNLGSQNSFRAQWKGKLLENLFNLTSFSSFRVEILNDYKFLPARSLQKSGAVPY